MVTLPIYNILLLGPSQAGKSTFLEYVKQYAKPSYTIDNKRIGSGNVSETQEPHVDVVTTDLPIYKLFVKGGDEFDASGLIDEKSFKRFLVFDDDLELRSVEVLGSPMVQFRIIDTPGLNDTNGDDIKNIARTFSTLSEVGYLNMIIILESHHVTLNPAQVETFKTYFKLFEELNGLITIVHTHSPNQFRLPGLNPGHDKKLKERSDFFNRFFGRAVPTLRIDCDLNEKGPAHTCMTRNAIRQILEVAKVKAPVSGNTTQVRKIQRMIDVDKLVHVKYVAKLSEYHKRCQSESQTLTVKIEDIEKKIKKLDDDIRRHDTDELLQLHEDRFDEQVDFFGWFYDLFGRANNEHTMEFPVQKHTIDDIDVAQYGINVLEESGGKGNDFWKMRFKRYQFNTGYYHAVLKTKKSTKFRTEIEEWKSERNRLNMDLEDLETKKQNLGALLGQDVTNSADVSSNDFSELRGLIDNCRDVLDLLAADTLPLDLFMELADEDVYRNNMVEDADAVEKFLGKKFGIV
ncbi:MAG: hypothetical protein J3Q66DRAFT_168723 [Benniella sp.]|nr:MAG: hypothetical protein J3Q66DRAFT_168723 [Benniella sp.]